ncbi:regulatory protein RecX [Prauserella endophytica]|uniref:Regulatory protein RecX n=1 Tax=Prauserella endophytica TaxID=1592324 RepID=A0ABY2S206_9PSEU|nr:regulatory protein RecX [Prauserella endophytica]TKG69091.1 regulatory protein RecX [Prauserella endophytica]
MSEPSSGGARRSRARPVSELTPEEARKKAKEVCLDLLAARPRTKDELRKTLRRKGFDDELSETLLGKLDHAGLVDDAAFAEMWVRSRHAYQGLAKRALVAELRRKGVDSEVAAEAAGEIDRDAEEDRARQLVRKKLRTMSEVDEQTATRRLLGMLARKGYPQGLSYAVVREELRDAGAESTMLDDVTLE